MGFTVAVRAKEYITTNAGVYTLAGLTGATGLSGTLHPDVRVELVRKSIHMLIAFVPFLAGLIGTVPTMSLLALGTVFYAVAETERLSGRPVFLVGRLTALAQRQRDVGHFVMGPVTLGLGAMTALLLYPYPAAAIAIYALAFGDGLASLVGKAVGTTRLPINGVKKTIEGSTACFLAVFSASAAFVGRPSEAFAIAATATVLEALPTRDLDNLVLPVGTGLVASLLFLS